MEPDLLAMTARTLGGRLFVALWGSLAAVDVAGRAFGGLVAAIAVVALVAVCDVRQSVVAAATIAGTGWLVINGFVLHRYGELGFGTSSWWSLVGVLAVGVGVALCTGPRVARR
jgi:hypothetical protein